MSLSIINGTRLVMCHYSIASWFQLSSELSLLLSAPVIYVLFIQAIFQTFYMYKSCHSCMRKTIVRAIYHCVSRTLHVITDKQWCEACGLYPQDYNIGSRFELKTFIGTHYQSSYEAPKKMMSSQSCKLQLYSPPALQLPWVWMET